MADPTTTVDLAITVTHTQPSGGHRGTLRALLTWGRTDITPVQRIQLIESAQDVLSDALEQAIADHRAGG